MMRYGLVLCCLLLAGCSNPVDPAPNGDGAPTDGSPKTVDGLTILPLKTVAANTLPIDSERPFPGAPDGGRLELNTPKEWDWLPKRSEYIAAFYFKDKNAPPLIFLREAKYPVEGVETVTSESVAGFAEKVAANLKQNDVKPIEPIRPMMLGDTPVVRYVLLGKRGNNAIERQILVTVQNGRQYEIDLQMYPKTMEMFRDAGYAVAASMKFISGASPEPEPTDADSSS